MRRAFSLIEVLLAILILAMGLLGLGAVIPVVVKQQRNASDATQGVTAAKAAQAYLLSRPEFSETSTSITNAWDHMLAYGQWSPTAAGAASYIWQPWSDSTADKCHIDLDTGDMRFQNTAIPPIPASSAFDVRLLTSDRIWPGQSGQPVQTLRIGEDPYRPQFVWDFIGRRILAKPGMPQPIQVAIFVRRIDLNIKVPRAAGGPSRGGLTLLDVLTGSNGVGTGNNRCVPVAVVSDNDPTPTGRGNTVPGTRYYANFLSLDAWFNANRRDRIEVFAQTNIATNASADVLLSLASQPGQKLLDNFGNVYTVQRLDEIASSTGRAVLIVDPPVPASVPDPASPSANMQLHEYFRQVVFTPQVPGAVHVFTVTRPVK